MRSILFLISIILLGGRSAHATPQSDFNTDGISDQSYVSIDSNTGALNWGAKLSVSGADSSIAAFGENGDHLILGNWEGNGPNVGVIEQISDTLVRWKIIKNDSSVATYDLGKPSDLFISGADFDGTGALDIAVVSQSGSSLVWTVVNDPFKAGGGQSSSFVLGSSRSLPFFFRPYNSGDFAAILNTVTVKGAARKQFRGRSVTGQKFKKVLLPKSVSGAGRPQAVKLASGRDALLFVRQAADATRLIVVSIKGRILLRATVPMAGTVVVGDFQQGGAEEVLVTDSSGAGIVTNLGGAQTAIDTPTGVPVDEINLNSFSGGANPGICEIGDPTDGSGKFVWKPNSDTQRFAVAVLPGRFTGTIEEVQLETASGEQIESLRYKGLGNPDSEGQRSNWISRVYTGQALRSEFTSVVLRVIFSNQSCLLYSIANPATRYD